MTEKQFQKALELKREIGTIKRNIERLTLKNEEEGWDLEIHRWDKDGRYTGSVIVSKELCPDIYTKALAQLKQDLKEAKKELKEI